MLTPQPKTRAAHCIQRGVGLVEVLVALVISAIGLLALMAGQGAALRHGVAAQHHALGAGLVADIGERMRANPAAWAAGLYQYRVAADEQLASAVAAPAIRCDGASSACSAEQLAASDLASWRALARASLPAGVTWLGPDATGVDVWVGWRAAAAVSASGAPATCPAALAGGGGFHCTFARVSP